MAFSIKIIHENKYIYYSHSGEISLKEIEEAWGELLNMNEMLTLHKHNIHQSGIVGKFEFCTYTQIPNSFINWSYEIPASA